MIVIEFFRTVEWRRSFSGATLRLRRWAIVFSKHAIHFGIKTTTTPNKWDSPGLGNLTPDSRWKILGHLTPDRGSRRKFL